MIAAVYTRRLCFKVAHSMKFNFLKDYFLLFVGAVVQALCMVLFLVRGQIAAGGVSGTAQIINHYSGLPIGTMILIGNIPLFIAGWKFLGGRRSLDAHDLHRRRVFHIA